ncbi:MAG: hypothetical protein ACFFA6_04955 [Promethearchaeota archaeon]
MSATSYWLGVFLALLAGSITQFGTVLQKKAVNNLTKETDFLKSLIKEPIWISGVVLSFGISSIFFLTAQVFIGPTLIPGLMAFGLIILALGSIRIIGEKLKTEEILGIFIMILGTFSIGMSGLSIDITETSLSEIGFMIRTILFTSIIVFLSLLCQVFQKKFKNFKGILLAIISGLMFALSNFWVSQFMAVIANVLRGVFNLTELLVFIISGIFLISTNILGLATIQQAFRVGQASNMIPIQQVPSLLVPIFIYFLVFLLDPPNIFSLVYTIIGIILILISSFLLGKRQAQLEEIK